MTDHCSKFSNYIGLFRYPVDIWSYDACVKPIEIEAAILELRKSNLIEYDADQQTIRLVGWFYSLDAPDNGNQMKGHIKSFQGITFCPPEIFCCAAAEFTVSSFIQTSNWEATSPEHKKAYDAFRSFLKTQFFKYGDDFNTILMNEINSRGKIAYGSIQACYQMLPSDGLQTVEPFRKGFDTVSKQEKKGEENKSKNKNLDAPMQISKVSRAGASESVHNSSLVKEARKSRM